MPQRNFAARVSQDAKHARTYQHGDPLAEALRQPVSVNAGADDAQYASGTEGNGDGDGHDPRYVDPQGSYPSTDDQETPYEQSYAGRARRRGSLITVAAVLGLAIVGTAGAFGYGTFTGSGSWSQPTVIKADNTPTSIAPSPSSSDGQGSKLVHERADKSQPEPVVSQEQPIEVKDAAPKVLTARLATEPRTTSSQKAMDYAPAPRPEPLPSNPRRSRHLRSVQMAHRKWDQVGPRLAALQPRRASPPRNPRTPRGHQRALPHIRLRSRRRVGCFGTSR